MVESDRREYRQILRAIGDTPWAMHPPAFHAMCEVVLRRMQGIRLEASEIAEAVAGGPGSPRQDYQSDGNVAVVPIYGVLIPRASMMSEMSGGTSLARISAVLDQVANDPGIGTVILDVASPGGSVEFTPEVADKVRALGASKRTIAVANGMAASGAYWIASQATEFIVTPSGLVGSIGVYSTHQDISAQQEQEGISTTLISAGKYKTETLPYGPLTEEAIAAMQAMVDEYYGMFVAAVARGRGASTSAVRAGYGQGRVVTAKQAVAAGMADKVGTFDSVLQSALRSRGAGRRRAAAEVVQDIKLEGPLADPSAVADWVTEALQSEAEVVDNDRDVAEEAAAVDEADAREKELEETELLDIAAKVGAITTSLTGGNP